MEKAQRDYTIGALEDGLSVLFALGVPEYIQLSLKELSQSLGLTVNTTFRILKTLERRQLVEEVDGKWRIAPTMTRFAVGYMRYYERRMRELEREKMDHLGHPKCHGGTLGEV